MKIFDKIKQFFKREEKVVEEYFQPIIANIKAHYGDYFMEAVQIAVGSLAGAAMPGTSKLSIVLGAFKSIFLSRGVPYLENIVRGAVEASVAALPASQAAITMQTANLIAGAIKNDYVNEVAEAIRLGSAKSV